MGKCQSKNFTPGTSCNDHHCNLDKTHAEDEMHECKCGFCWPWTEEEMEAKP